MQSSIKTISTSLTGILEVTWSTGSLRERTVKYTAVGELTPDPFRNLLMEQARIEHAPNGSLLTYITSADALVNDETKKRAHDSQIVRAKENLKLSHGGTSPKTSIRHQPTDFTSGPSFSFRPIPQPST